MQLVVATSTGSSPGRQGYKMAIGADGELIGSIGGGVMEVRLAEAAKWKIESGKWKIDSELIEQIHRKDVTNASGMICSGKQSVIYRQLGQDDLSTVESIINALENRRVNYVTVTPDKFSVVPLEGGTPNGGTPNDYNFERISDTDFVYKEKLGAKNDLYIVGGGHCALALSELMSKMDFHIRIFDDRPELNTLEKNRFADEITIIDTYEKIGDHISSGPNVYVVVMTLGYASDEVVIRQIIGHDLKYFGVLGSMAKIKTLMVSLEKDGIAKSQLARIHTPAGLPINSHTPEEIAVSIAAEIIAIKNTSLC